MSPEEAKIIANKISLIGYVTVNNGFAIDTNGKMTANGATINGSVHSVVGTDSADISGAMLGTKKNGQQTVAISTASGESEGLVWLYKDGAPRLVLEGSGRIFITDENGKRRASLTTGSTYSRLTLRCPDGSENIMLDLIADSTNSNIEQYNASGVQRNYSGDGRFACYDASGTETARLSSDKSLKLGSTTLTEAALAKLLGIDTTNIPRTAFTPTAGQSYSPYGGCWYERHGKLCIVHIGISGLTANTDTAVFTLPTELIPNASVVSAGIGYALASTDFCRLFVFTDGSVHVLSQSDVAQANVMYFAT